MLVVGDIGQMTLEDFIGHFKNLHPRDLSLLLVQEIVLPNPSLKFIKFLLDLGTHVDNSHNDYTNYNSPLHLSAQLGHLKVMKLLVEFKANIFEVALFRGMPIHVAASNGQMTIIDYLISLGVDVNIKGPSYASPLHYAAKAGYLNIVTLLLEAGADIDSLSTYSTPIHWAVIGNQVEVVKLLIDKGADLEVIHYGFDGYGGENKNLILTALTASNDIGMGHQVTQDSRIIVKLLETAIVNRKQVKNKK